MSIAPAENEPWSFIQWAVTGAATVCGSAIAFLWRLTSRVDKLETVLTAQNSAWAANEGAMLRLAERLAQIHDDQSRVREALGGLPTRSDLRELEDRVGEQIAALGGRLDRAIDR